MDEKGSGSEWRGTHFYPVTGGGRESESFVALTACALCDYGCLAMKRPSDRECKKIAARFIKLRERLGIRQAELANLIDVRREEISRIENARIYPLASTLRRFAVIESRSEYTKVNKSKKAA